VFSAWPKSAIKKLLKTFKKNKERSSEGVEDDRLGRLIFVKLIF